MTRAPLVLCNIFEMTNKKWFINLKNLVQGPLDPGGIEKLVATDAKALIWGRGLPEWLPVHEWRQRLVQEEKMVATLPAGVFYKYLMGTTESEPLSFEHLIQSLRSEPQISMVQIWTSKLNKWNDIFTVEEVADELGLSRRSHPRVPIMGSYEGDGPDGKFKYTVVTISQGGLGLGEAKNFKLGDRLKGQLNSENLFAPIFCFSEVVFVGTDGYVGLRFVALPTEAQSSIIEYVKKFGDLV